MFWLYKLVIQGLIRLAVIRSYGKREENFLKQKHTINLIPMKQSLFKLYFRFKRHRKYFLSGERRDKYIITGIVCNFYDIMILCMYIFSIKMHYVYMYSLYQFVWKYSYFLQAPLRTFLEYNYVLN